MKTAQAGLKLATISSVLQVLGLQLCLMKRTEHRKAIGNLREHNGVSKLCRNDSHDSCYNTFMHAYISFQTSL